MALRAIYAAAAAIIAPVSTAVMAAVMAAGLLWGLLPGLAGAQEGGAEVEEPPPAGFIVHTLELERELGVVLPLDLEGDGRSELLVLEAEYQGRQIRLHPLLVRYRAGRWVRQGAAGAALPEQVLFVDAGTTAFGPSLVFATPGRLHLWAWQEGRLRPAASRPIAALHLPVLRRPPQRLPLLQDLSGDGLAECLLPLQGGVQLLRIEAGPGFVPGAAVQGVPWASISRLRLTEQHALWSRWPAVQAVDLDGRGWRDLLVFNDGLVAMLLLGEEGRAEPGGARFSDLAPLQPFDPKAPQRPYVYLARAGDLNGDALADLVLYKISSGEGAFESRMATATHYGRQRTDGSTEFSEQPQQVFLSQGVGFPILEDFNADGLVDLAVLQVDIGFWDVIKGLIARRVSGDALFRLMGQNGRHSRQPDAVRTYSVSFSLRRRGHQPIIAFGDLNGDGQRDLLLSSGKETLGIHWGKRKGFWGADPDVEWEGPLPARTRRVLALPLLHPVRDSLIFAYSRVDAQLNPALHRRLRILESRFAAPGSPKNVRRLAAGAPAR